MKIRLLLPLAVALLAGCIESEPNWDDVDTKLVIALNSADYSTSDIALFGDSDDAEAVVIENLAATTSPSDIKVNVYGQSIYRLGRYQSDNITKFAKNGYSQTLDYQWQYSVLGTDSSANPQAMLVVDSSKAYITRRGTDSLWQVNPSATSEAGFKTAEIDLSAFANATSGRTCMSGLALVDDYLYVMLQNLDKGDYGACMVASSPSKVVVIDTTDNSLVDTDSATAGTQAITLPVNNASNFVLVGDTFYINGVGDYFNADYKYTGGIVTLDTTDFSTNLLLDSSDSANMPYGNITAIAVTSGGDLYFSGSAAWGDNRLYYRANGSSTAVEISLGNAAAYNISGLVLIDDELFVGVHGQTDKSDVAGIKVVSTATNSLVKTIETSLNPTQIIPVY